MGEARGGFTLTGLTGAFLKARRFLLSLVLVLPLFGAVQVVFPDSASAALTAWKITPNSANYIIGSPTIPTLTATLDAAGGTANCYAYTSADTSYTTPLTISTLTAGTYKVHCTVASTNSGYAVPTYGTDNTLTVLASASYPSFTCNSNFYQSATGGSGTGLFRLTPSGSSFTYSSITYSGTGLLPNGMGWNPDDNYIYGFSTTTNLVRIAGNGTITSLGALTSGDSATLGKAATAQNTGGDFVRINGTEYL